MTKVEILKTVKRKIKSEGITQEEFAAEIGKSTAMLNLWLNNKRGLTANNFFKLVNAAGYEINITPKEDTDAD